MNELRFGLALRDQDGILREYPVTLAEYSRTPGRIWQNAWQNTAEHLAEHLAEYGRT